MEKTSDQNTALECLQKALEVQRAYLTLYERPSEPIIYEILRTFDDLFCRDLMEPGRSVGNAERLFRSLSTWGVNHALRRIMPKTLSTGPFRDFPSSKSIQKQTDDFVFNCGTLQQAERFEGWLQEGILTGEVRTHFPRNRPTTVLKLCSADASCYDEEIGRAGLRWASDQTWTRDREEELQLEERYRAVEPELRKHAKLAHGWRITYSSTPQIDEYFQEWAHLYLRRIFSQDMIGQDDTIGGRKFSRYVEVLTALSGRSQKHIAFAAILRARHPSVHIRNLLTTFCHRETFVESLARYMDADFAEISDILSSFTLTPDNLHVHTKGADTAWTPLVQASADNLILPTYGIDINPFLFLFTDLRHRYEKDWFRVANNREARWIEEIKSLFEDTHWQVHSNSLRLREGRKELTDIDFAVYDRTSNELALFQLKWQHPIGTDNRGRRSTGKNLVVESNRWIATVISWLDQWGASELMKRLGFENSSSPVVHFFVIGRYHAHLSGFDDLDHRAVWSDWAHFRRAKFELPTTATVTQLASMLQSTVAQSRAMKGGESIIFPVGDLSVVLDPI